MYKYCRTVLRVAEGDYENKGSVLFLNKKFMPDPKAAYKYIPPPISSLMYSTFYFRIHFFSSRFHLQILVDMQQK